MKKLALISVFCLLTLFVNAQKFAFVDTDYILKNIPSYKAAQDKLETFSNAWQKEIEDARTEVDKMYKEYQSERVMLTDEMKQRREEKIMEKEKQVRELQKQYFGTNGKLFEKREELIKPIQDEVYRAVKSLAEKGNYAVIFDTAAGVNMLYTDPKFDKSDEVLEAMGYKN
jgi:outer membrane protein